jgi:hypothetical protein
MDNTEMLIDKFRRLLVIKPCLDSSYKRVLVPQVLKDEIYNEQNGKCFLCYCKTATPLTHHIVPDGESIKSNLVMMCPLCHRSIHWLLKKYLNYRGSNYQRWD